VTQYESKSKGHKQHDPGMELSIGQVLAAAGATVLGAVLAKLLGLWGTLAGTAVLSVCSSIGAVLILRAMRRTGEKIKEQITALAPVARGKAAAVTQPLGPGSATAVAKVPGTAPDPDATTVLDRSDATRSLDAADVDGGSDATEVLGTADTDVIVIPAEPAPEGHVSKTRSNKRTLVAILVSSVLVFALTITTLFLLGALTGDPERFVSDGPETTIIETHIESDAPESPTTSEAPTESGSPSETATSEAPSPSTSPSESATTESPSSSPSPEAGSGGSEATPSPTPQDDTVSESPATE
jgi:cell division septation protein DedD